MNGLRIKYWDETNEKMWQLHEIAETYNDWTFQTIVMEGELYGLIHRSFDVDVGQNPYEEYRVLSLRRYTGIKDVNCFEIYEGDFLEIIYDSMLQERSVHEVKYCDDEGCPAFELQPTEDVEMNNFAWLTSDTDEAVISYRVIGNRYENPELLKELRA